MTSNPVIIIPGPGRSGLYLADENGNKTKRVWPVELDTKALLDEMKGSLMKILLFRTDAGFSDKIASVVNDATAPFALSEDGIPVNNIKTALSSSCYGECSEGEKKFINDTFPVSRLAAARGEDKIFYFEYNFLGNVLRNAEALTSLVSEVKEKTGCETVDFIVMSTGASVFKAWLKQNAVSYTNGKVVFVTAFLDGASAVADVYEGKLNLENPASILASLGEKGATLAQAAGMLPKEIIENVITKSMNVLRRNILDNSPSLWALIPVKRLDGALAELKPSAGLLADINENRRATENVKEALRLLQSNGVRLAFVCGKGKRLPEAFASSDVDCDGILDASSASLDGEFAENTLFSEGIEHTVTAKNDELISFVENFLA